MSYHKKVAHHAKHFLIPHIGNDFRPHIFRELSVLVIISVSALLLGISIGRYYFLNRTVLGAEISSTVLVDLTNESRISMGKNPLAMNSKLEEAAKLKAIDMRDKEYFSHTGPDGTNFWHWVQKAGYDYLFAGENLAVNFLNSKDVRDAWMNSPTHKDNLLAGKFTEIGISTSEGMLDGANTVFVVQMFGTPYRDVSGILKSQPSSTDINEKTEPIKKLDIPSQDKSIAVSSGSILVTAPINKNVEQLPSESLIVENSNTLASENKILNETKDSIMVERNFVTDTVEQHVVQNNLNVENVPEYSSRLDKIIYFYSSNLSVVFKFLALIFFVILFVGLVLEYRNGHFKHIAYGSFVVLSMLVMFSINQFFM